MYLISVTSFLSRSLRASLASSRAGKASASDASASAFSTAITWPGGRGDYTLAIDLPLFTGTLQDGTRPKLATEAEGGDVLALGD